MKKSLFFFFVFVLFFFSSLTANAENSVERISGQDRFLTAIEVSKRGWVNADTIVLAVYNNFADALTAAPLAKKSNAPILLTQTNVLTQSTKAEIQRLHPKNAYVVGGIGVISNQVISELQSMGINVKRLGGNDRFATASIIAQELGGNPENAAVIVNGMVFPDALSIAPWAAMKGYPILPVLKDNITDSTKQVLRNLNIQQTFIIGGTGVVSDPTKNQFPNATRVSGGDRYATSAEIARQLFGSVEKTYVATGSDFADALTGSVLAGKQNLPLLLTTKDQIPQAISNVLNEKNIKQYSILGGVGVVGDSIVSVLSSINIPLPLAGKVIVLDPGHGGSDPGAVQNGFNEKDLNWIVVQKIVNRLSNSGATILLTRNNDSYVSLQDRAAFTNQKNADLFVSIHHDSNPSPTPEGISTHYSTYRPGIVGSTADAFVTHQGQNYPYVREVSRTIYFNMNGQESSASIDNIVVYDPTPTEAAQKSKVLAERLAQDISNLGFKKAYTSSGSKDHNLYVTRWTNMPSVLIENGFISNPTEVQKVTNPAMQDQFAQVVADHILRFFNN